MDLAWINVLVPVKNGMLFGPGVCLCFTPALFFEVSFKGDFAANTFIFFTSFFSSTIDNFHFLTFLPCACYGRDQSRPYTSYALRCAPCAMRLTSASAVCYQP
jgi:hypothetical protein